MREMDIIVRAVPSQLFVVHISVFSCSSAAAASPVRQMISSILSNQIKDPMDTCYLYVDIQI